MTHAISTAGFKPVRHDQLRVEYEHDAYRSQEKLAEPSVCRNCGAIYRHGRWEWGARPVGAEPVLCAACRRMQDHFPAGFLFAGGPFFEAHREQILQMIRHREEREKTEHALVRIMDVEDSGDGILVTTTDIRLARALGEALSRAYGGELEFHYNAAEHLLRVHWRR